MTPCLSSQTLSQCISKTFTKQMIDLFDSEDPRERDYLKTLMHRIYGKFMPLRTQIREQIMNLLLRVTYECDSHNGLTEVLEIFSSIVSGYTVPLKEEHRTFFKKVIVPLHKVKTLNIFNQQLSQCVKNYLEKDNSLALPLVQGF